MAPVSNGVLPARVTGETLFPSTLSNVVLLQGLVCFVIWIGYGVFRMRRSAAVRAWALSIPAARRAILGGGFFLAGAGLLALALTAIMMGHGLSHDGMTLWAWLLVAVTGIGYAHLQILGTALLVSLAQDAALRERTERRQASDAKVTTEPLRASEPTEVSPSDTGSEFLP